MTAPADKQLLVEQVVKSLDVPENADSAVGEDQTPRIEVYPVDVGTAEGIAKIMDTTFRRSPETRVSPHPDGRALIVAATPREHQLIKAVLLQLKGEGLKFEVLPLRVLDAGSTVSLIKAMLNVKKDGREKQQGFSFFYFPIPDDDDDKPGPNTGFSIEADVDRNRLLVRGTESQISQVRDLLVQMGETGISRGAGGLEKGRFRVLPLGDRDPEETARQLERLWSRLGAKNQIKVEVLSDRRPADDRAPPPDESADPAGDAPPSAASADDPIALKVEELKALSAEEQEAEIAKLPAFLRQRVRNLLKTAAPGRAAPVVPPVPPVRSGASTAGRDDAVYRTVGYEEPVADRPLPPAAKAEPKPPASSAKPPDAAKPSDGAGTPVRVVVGDDNIAIASDDPEALELMDKLLATLLRGKTGPTGSGMAIYYLKSSDASDMALLVGRSPVRLVERRRQPRRRVPGWYPTPAPTRCWSSGPPAEQKKVQELLDVLDAEDAPATNIGSQQRAVELRYGRASEIAKTLKEVFAADLYTPAAQGGDGGGGGGSGRRQTGGNPRGKLSVGVDEESNLILVSAPKALADAVEDMAIGLDEAAKDNGRTARVVTLKNAKPEAMKAALEGLFGLRTAAKNGQGAPAAGGRREPGEPRKSRQPRKSRRRRFDGVPRAATTASATAGRIPTAATPATRGRSSGSRRSRGGDR